MNRIKCFLKKIWNCNVIKKSGFFDEHFYLEKNPDVRIADQKAFKHYCKYGIKENRKPNLNFDPVWYLSFYDDVKEEDFFPLVHFIKFGSKENRFQNMEEMDEYNALQNKGFEIDLYRNGYKDLSCFTDEGFDCLLHYIRYGKNEVRSVILKSEDVKGKFAPYSDDDLKEVRFKNVIHSQEKNINHVHSVEDLLTIIDLNINEIKQYKIIESKGLDWSQYFKCNAHKFKSNDPIIDYIKSWSCTLPIVPEYFDTNFYLDLYKDIKNASVMPLIHFIKYGEKEGRQAKLNPDCIQQGGKKYDPKKETIVFVSHESSATGAPLLGYCISDKLGEKYNIVHMVLKKSNIHDAFLGNCDLILHDVQKSAYISSYYFLKQLLANRTIKCVIINSIVGYQTMYAAHKLEIPIVFLIHEFAEYMRPFGTMIDAVLYSDFVVTPAKIIQDSILKEFKRFENHNDLPKNMVIHPQGKLPCIPDTYGDADTAEELYKKLKITSRGNVKVIVGSGWVQIRKGVDLFIAVARYIKKLYGGECRFVWVGGGFEPDNDLSYSVYLEREIEFSGLEDDFVFLEHQKNLDNIFSIADVFCLASRMDPFPNVVIDALGHDLHVACFDHGSGSAEFLQKHNANASIVEFVDTYAMAESITHYLKDGNKKHGINQNILKKHLDFEKYVSFLDELTDQAVAFKEKTQLMTNELLQSGLFDVDFYPGSGNGKDKCRRYIECGLKGMHFHNAKIGFSESDWLEKHSKNNNAIVPLYEVIKANKIETLEVLTLPNNNCEPTRFKYAVHLHLHCLDMASYFISYFKNLPQGYDLFITIVKNEAKEAVEMQFSECGAAQVKVVCVENIGRDIAPLLFALKDELLSNQYEVVGHFHSKKSLDLETGGDDKWLECLVQHLIGDKNNAQSVLSVFNDPVVGLVFPEDTNTTNISEYKEFVAHLCKMLDMPVRHTPHYPKGNMFWARVGALKDLLDLDAQVVLQSELLSTDSSYLHAIGQVISLVAERNGYKYATHCKRNHGMEVFPKKELCIVHIGMPKTGSSILQEVLLGGIDDLRVSYIRLKEKNQGCILYGMFMEDPEHFHHFATRGWSPSKIKEFSVENQKLLVNGFLKFDTSIEILSGEDLYHFSQEAIKKLKHFLNPYFKKIVVVGYVRPIKSFLESAFQELVKYHGLRTMDCTNFYHPYKKFKRYDKIFGADNVKLFKYDLATLSNGDIVQDFCQKLNLKFSKSEKKLSNASISKEAISILFTYNYYADIKTDFGVENRAVQDKLVVLLRGVGNNKFRFSGQYMAKVLELYKDDYDWIKNRMSDDLYEYIDINDTSGISSEQELIDYSMAYINDLVGMLGTTPIPFELVKHPQTVAKLVDLVMKKIYNEMNQTTQVSRV